MIVLILKDVDLFSCMFVYCLERGLDYDWMYYNVIGMDEDVYNYIFVFRFIGFVWFVKGLILVGLYKVSLNVILDVIWM